MTYGMITVGDAEHGLDVDEGRWIWARRPVPLCPGCGEPLCEYRLDRGAAVPSLAETRLVPLEHLRAAADETLHCELCGWKGGTMRVLPQPVHDIFSCMCYRCTERREEAKSDALDDERCGGDGCQ